MKIKEEKHSQEKQVSVPASLAWSFHEGDNTQFVELI